MAKANGKSGAKAPQKKTDVKAPEIKKEDDIKDTTNTYHRPDYEPDETVIREMMIQKSCSREAAIEILKNPTKHPLHNKHYAKGV